MTIRTSSRSITSTAAASSSKRTLVQPQSENDSATKDTENSTITSRSKRARYVPPALNAENAPVAVKLEQQEESIVQPELSTPLRYSLRRKVSGNGIVKSESDEILPMFKMEDGEEEIESSISTPKKKEQLEILTKQRKRIIAPVDTLGCEENGRDEKRKDLREMVESPEESAKRARFTTLVSLMLSSQTKDPVTAEAVHNLQRNLPNGLCLDSILNATQDQISSNINKVGFWRRKTGYIQSAARILRDDFEGDIPKTIDELCSLPGVGPKMGFLALQSAWNINVGIGVDVHVHRVSNRLKWVKSNDPEGTRLQLQSWLPKDLHRAAKLCPSYRKVDPKSIASRVKVELLPEEDEEANELEVDATDAVKLEGPEGSGTLLVKQEDERLDCAQFGDPITKRFFMRVHAESDTPFTFSQSSLKAEFEQQTGIHSLDFEFHNANERPRTLIMVSKIGHCLNDLLFRVSSGSLAIDVPVIPEKTKEWQESEILKLCAQYKIDLVVLARYMQILSPKLCEVMSGRIINIHHSFLPSFKGARPYHQAYERGIKLIGATAHYVTADLDEGPIIEQDVERVNHSLPPLELTKAGADIEARVLARAVRWHSERRVILNGAKTVVFN
ncbi:hypothetical protein L7F22_044017 [Adiantum nelumboides]|nr:hypothetical protein [Adiantum nelumboides]